MPQAPLPEKDLHAQKSSEDYRQARSLDESLLNAAGLGIITTTPGGIITSFNQSAVTLLGYSPDEVIGKTTPVIFHLRDEIEKRAKQHSDDTGETLDPVFDIIVTKARRQKTPDRSEWTFIRKNRSRFHGSLTIICLRDERDNITGFAGIIADLSTQLTLMQQIEISEEKFRLLAENIPGAIYLCHNDENYTIIYLNDAIHSLTGYTKEDYYSVKVDGAVKETQIFFSEFTELFLNLMLLRDILNETLKHHQLIIFEQAHAGFVEPTLFAGSMSDTVA